jgi:hypothetical protein
MAACIYIIVVLGRPAREDDIEQKGNIIRSLFYTTSISIDVAVQLTGKATSRPLLVLLVHFCTNTQNWN